MVSCRVYRWILGISFTLIVILVTFHIISSTSDEDLPITLLYLKRTVNFSFPDVWAPTSKLLKNLTEVQLIWITTLWTTFWIAVIIFMVFVSKLKRVFWMAQFWVFKFFEKFSFYFGNKISNLFGTHFSRKLPTRIRQEEAEFSVDSADYSDSVMNLNYIK